MKALSLYIKDCVRVEGAERHAQSDGSGDSRSSLAGEAARWGPDAIMKSQWLCGQSFWLHSPGALSWGLRRMWCDRLETLEARRNPHRSLGTRDTDRRKEVGGADSPVKQGNYSARPEAGPKLDQGEQPPHPAPVCFARY